MTPTYADFFITSLANRFWLMQNLGRPIVLEEESRVPESQEAIVTRYRETVRR
jgi:hypothetical protein